MSILSLFAYKVIAKSMAFPHFKRHIRLFKFPTKGICFMDKDPVTQNYLVFHTRIIAKLISLRHYGCLVLLRGAAKYGIIRELQTGVIRFRRNVSRSGCASWILVGHVKKRGKQ